MIWRTWGWIFAGIALLGAPGCMAQEGTIGAMLGQRGDGRLYVRDAPPSLAASRHGLSEGDEILLIDGRDVRRMDASVVHQALSGEVGSSVKITALRGAQVVRVTLARSEAPRGPGTSK